MATGKYWRRFLLRNDYAFDNIIEEVVIDYAEEVLVEEETVPLHTYRMAMAKRLLAFGRTTVNPSAPGVSDAVVESFHRALKDRAVREEAFVDAAFANATPDPQTGELMPRAQDIPDAYLENGIKSQFNAATLEAWPTIQADVDKANEPPEEPGDEPVEPEITVP